MNDQELDEALAGFRDDVPEMSDGAFLLGKLRLEVAMEPAPEPLPAPKPLAVRVEVVDVQRRRSPPPKRLAPWLITAAAVLAVVAMTLALRDTNQPTAHTPAAPSDELRTVEEPRPLPPPVRTATDFEFTVKELGTAPGQFLKMSRDEFGLPIGLPGPKGTTITMHGAAEGRWQEWVPADRSGQWQLTRDVDLGAPTPAFTDEQPAPTMVSGLSNQEGTFRAAKGDYFTATKGSWLEPTSEFIAGLPRDPKSLYQRLATDSAKESDPQAVAMAFAGGLLSRPVPADLRAALYQALTYHPWLKVDPHQRTRDGRPAVALSADNATIGRSIVLLIDPLTGLMIGQREIWLIDQTAEQKVGSVVWETAVHWSVVDGLGK